jgi:hypothetical protein
MVGFFSVGILPVGILLGRHITWSAFCFLVGWSVIFRSANSGRLFAGRLLSFNLESRHCTWPNLHNTTKPVILNALLFYFSNQLNISEHSLLKK